MRRGARDEGSLVEHLSSVALGSVSSTTKKVFSLSMVEHTCNPSTQKAEAGG
jgi:hypothetical protein